MDAIRAHMVQLAKKGYYCSQILIILGLEAKGETNPDLVRSIGGLAGGCDEGSCTCGSLTGGCCLLALFAGKGSDGEERQGNYHLMMKELVRWFWLSYGFKYGGIDCMAIREGDPDSVQMRCWQMMESVYFKVMDILASNDICADYNKAYAS